MIKKNPSFTKVLIIYSVLLLGLFNSCKKDHPLVDSATSKSNTQKFIEDWLISQKSDSRTKPYAEKIFSLANWSSSYSFSSDSVSYSIVLLNDTVTRKYQNNKTVTRYFVVEQYRNEKIGYYFEVFDAKVPELSKTANFLKNYTHSNIVDDFHGNLAKYTIFGRTMSIIDYSSGKALASILIQNNGKNLNKSSNTVNNTCTDWYWITSTSTGIILHMDYLYTTCTDCPAQGTLIRDNTGALRVNSTDDCGVYGGPYGGGTPTGPVNDEGPTQLDILLAMNTDFLDWYSRLNPTEISLAVKFPIAAFNTYINGKIASDFAMAKFPLLVQIDDRADAVRHATWNALNTRDNGLSLATAFADAHEVGNSGLAVSMDLHNNKWGRDAFIALTQLYSNPTDGQIGDSIMAMLASGTLRYIYNGQLVPTFL
jgi:hypothetical protein